jgi:hypothetical protein
MPDPKWVNDTGYIVRMNDGHDSNYQREKVIGAALYYNDAFYNTSIPNLDFPGPVVLTINPGKMTDEDFHKIDVPPKNLMFVRFRVNTWNLKLADDAITYYTKRGVPIVLTYMAYTKPVPEGHRFSYPVQQRTTNEYFAISQTAWELIMMRYTKNPLVYSCGRYGCVKWEGGKTGCAYCGNCLREYFATKIRCTQ